jgi:hypothetical protein
MLAISKRFPLDSHVSLLSCSFELETQLVEFQRKINAVADEQWLYSQVREYAHHHDICVGIITGLELDANWESCFTPNGVSDLYQ